MGQYSVEDRTNAARATAVMFSGTDFGNVHASTAHDLVESYFDQFLRLITGTYVKITFSPVTEEQDGSSSRQTTTIPGGVKMQDTEQVHATLEFDDAKGFATVDGNAVTWSVADTSVCTAVPDTDGSGGVTFVAGNPGSTVATVTDGVVSGTVALDVTPGGVASIKVTLGTPVAQPAPAPPAPAV